MDNAITLDQLRALVRKLEGANIAGKTVVIRDAQVAQIFDDLNTELETLED